MKNKVVKKFVNQYPVVVQEDVSHGYWVSCPVLDGCYSQGDTIEEALVNIKEAIELCLEDESSTTKQRVQKSTSLHFVKV